MTKIDWNLIKVLVVEDDATTREMLSLFLKKIGCMYAVACNGLEAIDLTKTYNFDVCFMDLFMPKMGGVEATLIIREEIDQRLPIIALTSADMSANKKKCLDVGMNDYIQKPIGIKKLREFVKCYGVKCAV